MCISLVVKINKKTSQNLIMGGCVCNSAPPLIDWADSVDAQTLQDAWETYKTHFAKKQGRKVISQLEFEKYSAGLKNYTTIPLSDFVNNKKIQVSNMNRARLSADTAEEAYPPTDNPRGEQDIKSVEYLVNTTHEVSPIVMVRTGKTSYILLDGMHRLVASKLRSGLEDAQISVLIIP